MKLSKKLLVAVALFCIPSSLYVASLYSACCGQAQRTEGAKCPDLNCAWGTIARRCSGSSECCPGRFCTAWGTCELCSDAQNSGGRTS